MLFQVSLTSIWLSAISSTVVRLSASVATSSEQAQSLQRGEERRRRGRKQDWNSNSRFLTVPLARPLAFPPSCFARVVINFSHSCSLRLWHCPPPPRLTCCLVSCFLSHWSSSRAPTNTPAFIPCESLCLYSTLCSTFILS